MEPAQSYRNFVSYIKWITESEPDESAKDKLLDVLRRRMTTLAEAEKGDKYIWPSRLTTVLVNDKELWKFSQMTFSFPTIYPSDVQFSSIQNLSKKHPEQDDGENGVEKVGHYS